MPIAFEYRDPCLTIEDLTVRAGCQPSAVREAIELFGPQFKNMDGELLYRGSEGQFEGMTIEEFCATEHLKKAKPHWFFADSIVSLEEQAFGGPTISLKARGELMKEVGNRLYTELMVRWGATHTKNGVSPGPSPKQTDRSPEGAAKANNPWSKAGWNLTAQGSLIRAIGLEKAQGVAKAVRSYVGATKPSL